MKKLWLILIALIIILAIIFYLNQAKKVAIVKTEMETEEIKQQQETIPVVSKKKIVKKTVEQKQINPLDVIKKDCKSQSSTKTEEYFCLAKSGLWLSSNNDILSIVNANGWSVAHSLAQFNANFNPTEEVLYFADNNGLSVAHVLAEYNKTWTTKNKEILSLKNNAEESVAHFLVSANKLANIVDEEILNLTTSYGVSVRDLAKKRK